MTKPQNTQPESQKQRWLVYAPLMTLMIIATLFVIFALNWIAYDKFRTLRLDLTSTRQYSLSKQTTNLITALPTDITITTLYARGNAPSELLQKVDDLLAEYKRRSPKIKTQHIDPPADIQNFEAFNTTLLQRFATDLEPGRLAIEQALQSIDTLTSFASSQAPQIAKAIQATNSTYSQLGTLETIMATLGDSLAAIKTQTDPLLNQSLPNYTDARTIIESPLNEITTRVLTPAINQFNTIIDSSDTTDATRDLFLGLLNQYEKLNDQIITTIQDLQDFNTTAYDTLRRGIIANNALIVSVPTEQALDTPTRGLVSINLAEIFPNILRAQLAPQNTAAAPQTFKGEEVLTSAILQLTLAHNTRVVFINPTPISYITRTPRTNPMVFYSQVAHRLRKMNFIVDEWQPGGRTSPAGKPLPPQTRPIPKAGQTLIFISPPIPPISPDSTPTADPLSIAAGAVITHITEGRPAFLFFKPPIESMGFAPSDPRLDTLATFGLNIDTTQLIVRTVPASQGKTTTNNQIDLHQWPQDHLISRALPGLRGILVQAMPININPTDNVQTWPLAQTPQEAWASPDALAAMGNNGLAGLAQINRPDNATTGPFTVAVAAQKNNKRIIAISDPAWATDFVTNSGPAGPYGQPLYRSVPANAELFVNSVCWLANLDMLIAPGASTQDVRRIGPVSPAAAKAVTWATLLGLPLACLAAGLAVWLTRRN